MSGAFKVDNLQTFKPHLIQNTANFKIEETEVLQCLGQPNETVHSPLSQIIPLSEFQLSIRLE